MESRSTGQGGPFSQESRQVIGPLNQPIPALPHLTNVKSGRDNHLSALPQGVLMVSPGPDWIAQSPSSTGCVAMKCFSKRK